MRLPKWLSRALAPKHVVPEGAWTLPHLIEWLKTKDPRGRYEYVPAQTCLLAQYAQYVSGDDGCFVSPWTHFGGDRRKRGSLPPGWDDVSSCRPHTFGAALERAEKLLKREQSA